MRVSGILLAMALFIAPGVSLGASFDCARAGTRVEKRICASRVLSDLDERLAEAYGAVLRSSDDPGTVKSRQREWLKDVRDRCPDEACLKEAYEKRLAELASSGQTAAWKVFRDESLGIEFLHPADRTAVRGCRGSRRCVALIGPSMGLGDYLIAFEVFEGDLETVAAEKAVFEKRGEGWIAPGRSGEHPAAPISGEGWRGLRAVVDCGISDSRGFHAAAGECLWVVVSNGRRAVVADTQGLGGIDETLLRSIQTLRFIH